MTREQMLAIKKKLTQRPLIPGLQASVWRELEPLRRALLGK